MAARHGAIKGFETTKYKRAHNGNPSFSFLQRPRQADFGESGAGSIGHINRQSALQRHFHLEPFRSRFKVVLFAKRPLRTLSSLSLSSPKSAWQQLGLVVAATRAPFSVFSAASLPLFVSLSLSFTSSLSLSSRRRRDSSPSFLPASSFNVLDQMRVHAGARTLFPKMTKNAASHSFLAKYIPVSKQPNE
ncbi:hypothetical protein PIB30_066458 [Stylosanthes scabra]|uniref:Transmembrane protein n=1 Tax=Stylosanthes scabra TaxID=79078 RepID=A0ABU6RMH5_9FABA|nr:hypothetical protein [Stylosanthes scabra]